jgi:cold shock CspA family protein
MSRHKRPDDIARELAGEPPEPLNTRRRSIGMVKYWRHDKGHGAISCDDTAPWDIWCHFGQLEAAGGIAILPSGEEMKVTFDEKGRAYSPTGKNFFGAIRVVGRISVDAGDRVEVLYRRANQESFKYVAIHVRRLTSPI